MQGRMKQHQLAPIEIEQLLEYEKVGRIGTLNADGTPYVVPVHFVFADNTIYIHGLSKGQKIENISRNPNVCFEADHMHQLIMHEEPCNVNTAYRSVIITGTANLMSNENDKLYILNRIIDKYTPELSGRGLASKMVKATSVIKIEIKDCTGKYYG